MLEDPPLTALGSIVADQLGMVKKLDVQGFMCKNKETAEAIATLVGQSETVGQEVNCKIFIDEEIGGKGWAAIRRAIEHFSVAFGKRIFLDHTRKSPVEGRREDMKAIWENVFEWEVQCSL